MNYQRIYTNIIKRSKSRILEGYVEKHHIIPRCMEGSDLSENIVQLTPEEHFTVHLLLIKIYPNNPKLVHAAKMMCCTGKNRKNNKLYGWLKRRWIEVLSVERKGKVMTLETRTNISRGLKNSEKAKSYHERRGREMIGSKLSTERRENISKSLRKYSDPIIVVFPNGRNDSYDCIKHFSMQCNHNYESMKYIYNSGKYSKRYGFRIIKKE